MLIVGGNSGRLSRGAAGPGFKAIGLTRGWIQQRHDRRLLEVTAANAVVTEEPRRDLGPTSSVHVCTRVCWGGGWELWYHSHRPPRCPRAPDISSGRVSTVRTIILRWEAETFQSSACHPIFKRSSAIPQYVPTRLDVAFAGPGPQEDPESEANGGLSLQPNIARVRSQRELRAKEARTSWFSLPLIPLRAGRVWYLKYTGANRGGGRKPRGPGVPRTGKRVTCKIWGPIEADLRGPQGDQVFRFLPAVPRNPRLLVRTWSGATGMTEMTPRWHPLTRQRWKKAQMTGTGWVTQPRSLRGEVALGEIIAAN